MTGSACVVAGRPGRCGSFFTNTESETMIDYPALQKEVHEWAIAKGWLDPEAEPRPIAGLLMLVLTEVAESVEAHRNGNPACERPGMEHLTHMAEELADVVIRLVQMADEHGMTAGRSPHLRIGKGDTLSLHWRIVDAAVTVERWRVPAVVHVRQRALEDLFAVVEHVANELGIDLAEAVRLKMAFNWTRPHKHGKAC